MQSAAAKTFISYSCSSGCECWCCDPSVLSFDDWKSVIEISSELYFNSRLVVELKKRGMDAEQQVTQCSQQFLSHPNRQNLSNVDAFKYIFLKFSKYSSCTIATCDNRDYRNGPFNAYEINLDSVDFDFAKNFVLEVTAEDCPQTKHRFLLVVTEDPDLDVMIVVKTIGVKPIRSCAAAYSSNPLLVPTEHLPKYLRKLWSRFDTDFFRPMFEQPIYNLPMSQGSSGSLSRCSSL